MRSFTDVILRLTGKRTQGSFLDVKSIAPDHELADSLEKVLRERDKIRLRSSGRQAKQQVLSDTLIDGHLYISL